MEIESLISKLQTLKNRNLFFIVGMAKSGTTWLMHALNGHSNVLCSGEDQWEHLLPHIKPLCLRYNQHVQVAEPNREKKSNPFLYTKERREELMQFVILQLFLAQLENSDSQFLGSKQPKLWQFIGGVHSLLPSAKFINIIRDGRDVAVSMRRHNERVGGSVWLRDIGSIPDFVGSVGSDWMRTQRALREFGSYNPHNYFEVRYEDLLCDFEMEICRVLDFIGASRDRTDIEACRVSGSFERLSGRERGYEDVTSFYRKGVSGDWRNVFDQDCRNAFVASGALEYMKEFGYED